MKDRLIELICNCPSKIMGANMFLEKISADLADYLLANGVLVPPCKVGDVVYLLIDWGYEKEIEEKEVGAISIQGTNDFSKELWEDFRGGLIGTFADFGKTVFLTREEAEAALKGAEGK